MFRALATAAVATLTATIGLVTAAPAGANTVALYPGHILPFATSAFDCSTDADKTTTQSFVSGPATPPSGRGSLKFDFTNQDGNFDDQFRTDKYNGTKLADINDLVYSTYVQTPGKSPVPLRLTIDKDGNGTHDEDLWFIPANNPTEHAVAENTWQTWDMTQTTGLFNINGDQGVPQTLQSYVGTNPDAQIVATAAGGPETGGFTFNAGCGGGATAGEVTFIDRLVIDKGAGADETLDTWDLEAANPPRTLTISPTGGPPGSTITVHGTDCFDANVNLSLGESTGQSGNEVDSSGAATNPDGTFTGTLHVPANANPAFTYTVIATCGSAFTYDARPNFQVFTGSSGYRMVAADGGIFDFGDRRFHGSTGSIKLNQPIVGGATDKSTFDGYWIVAADGGVFAFNAPFFGSLGGQTLSSPAVEIEATPSGKGYWIVLADGKVVPFGDAKSFGDMSGKPLNKPIVGMSVTPSGKGYWLVGQDGGIFNFGDAGFFGSTGGLKLNAPVIDLAPAVDNNGYYLLAKDGGVFAYGSAVFKGSTGSMKLNAPVIAMLVNPTGSGYWLAATDGGIFSFGSIDFLGSMGGKPLNSPVLDLIN